MTHTLLPAAETKRVLDAGGTIIDVRTGPEHMAQHLAGAHHHVPLDVLDPQDFMLRHGLDNEAPVYMLCRSGMRARTAADKFSDAGYKNVFVIDGGILACDAAGIPVSSAAAATPGGNAVKIIPLERQVRIAAGGLTALTVALGVFCNPVFLLLTFGIGAGLVYAGVTDRCGMALLLAKAPWNKGAGATPASCGITRPAAIPDDGGKTGGGCA